MGSYDGADYKILDLTINRPEESYVGLFGYVENSTIKNLEIENVAVTGNGFTSSLAGRVRNSILLKVHVYVNVLGKGSNVGGLVGAIDEVEVTASHARGDVSGRGDYVGGLFGHVWHGNIIDSYARGDVSGESEFYYYVGGLVGFNKGEINSSYATGDVSGENWTLGGLVGLNYGHIYDSYAKGNVSTNDYAGGLVGRNSDGKVSNSYAEGDVSGNDWVGGLVGNNDGEISASYAKGDNGYLIVSGNKSVGGLVGSNSGDISNSYTHGMVSGENEVGGLVGVNKDEGTVLISYASGKVTGTEDIGGFLGINGATAGISYWDTESSGHEQGVGRGPTGEITGLTTDQMTGENAFENMTAFDFEETWQLTENYPALYWEDVDTLEIPTSSEQDELPVAYQLRQNYPNPFNPTTQISYSVSEQSHVRLEVYNALGQQVKMLVNEIKSTGTYEVSFDASNLSSGLYLYRIQAGEFVEQSKSCGLFENF